MQPSERLTFSVDATDKSTKARAGTLVTRRNTLTTPVFMPVATHGVVRGQRLTELAGIGFPILLANTYHLLLRPGCAILEKFGGIHSFMNWPNSVLTDSGGFQLFSLAQSIKVSEEGATFRSYIDGAKIELSPERSIATQRSINSDIMMVLDQVLPSLSDRAPMHDAMARTYRWAKRSLEARGDSLQALFGIVQGGCFLDLRTESAHQITSLPLDGYAIGGVAVGENKNIRDEIVSHTAALLPFDRPRYLMGVGTPLDLLEGVARGIDMFDCILPNALADHGKAFTYDGRMNLLRSVYADGASPIDPACHCSTCRSHSRAYLHQLLKASEPSANTLIGIHNLHFYFDLMSRMRGAIVGGSFHQLYKEFQSRLAENDVEFPANPPRQKRREQKRSRGDFEVMQSGDHFSIRHRSSGEIMHSVSDPYDEARRLYVEQTKLADRFTEDRSSPLVIWDVGLGSATNAMAALHRYEEEQRKTMSPSEKLAPLHIESFENDLDSLALTLNNAGLFPHIRHPAPYALIKEHRWRAADEQIDWRLIRGEFTAALEGSVELPAPDLIFYDPFSYKTNPQLWTWEIFCKLFERSKPNKTVLVTYSASTAVRAGLLAAGFCVGYGAPSGPKAHTTIATHGIRKEFIDTYLPHSWLGQWERSDNPHPPGLLPEQLNDFTSAVLRNFCAMTSAVEV